MSSHHSYLIVFSFVDDASSIVFIRAVRILIVAIVVIIIIIIINIRSRSSSRSVVSC